MRLKLLILGSLLWMQSAIAGPLDSLFSKVINHYSPQNDYVVYSITFRHYKLKERGILDQEQAFYVIGNKDKYSKIADEEVYSTTDKTIFIDNSNHVAVYGNASLQQFLKFDPAHLKYFSALGKNMSVIDLSDSVKVVRVKEFYQDCDSMDVHINTRQCSIIRARFYFFSGSDSYLTYHNSDVLELYFNKAERRSSTKVPEIQTFKQQVQLINNEFVLKGKYSDYTLLNPDDHE
jgi:hypothetical protein